MTPLHTEGVSSPNKKSAAGPAGRSGGFYLPSQKLGIMGIWGIWPVPS